MTIKEACRIFEIEYDDKINDKVYIKKRYKELAFIHHPDKGGTDDNFKLLNDAYELLHVHKYIEIPIDYNTKQGPSSIGKHPKQRRSRPLDARDATVLINLTVRELYKGFKQMLHYGIRSFCTYCRGRGCHICNGSLQMIEMNVEVQIHSTLINRDLQIIYDDLGDSLYEKADLVINLKIEDDEFELDTDYELPVVVSYAKVVPGQITLDFNSLDGPIQIRLPSDISKPLRLRNKGLPYKLFDDSIVRGDHIIKLSL